MLDCRVDAMPISKSKRLRIYDRDRYRCQYCGCHVDDVSASIDHIVPRCDGGGNHEKNLRTCCRDCNSIKGTSDIGMFRMRLALKNTKLHGVISASQYAQLVSLGVELDPLPVVRFFFEVNEK